MIQLPFNPNIHGWRFDNDDITWTIAGFIPGRHLCGGMVYSALDYYSFGYILPKHETTPPPEGSVLHSYIYDRQSTAHVNTVHRFIYHWGSDNPQFLAKVLKSEYEKLYEILKQNTPIPICLFNGFFKGHHILATGCTASHPAFIKIYDPNHPQKEGILVEDTQNGGLKSTLGGRWRGFFVDDGYTKQHPTLISLNTQSGWRWCRKCQGIFFSGSATQGVCPAGGSHDQSASGRYELQLDRGNGQPDWKWCSKCEGLYFGGHPGSAGICPAGGIHNGMGSGNYILDQYTPGGQSNWRWCSNCEGLFFAGNGSGRCPTGGGHTMIGSGDYKIPHNVVYG